jgi:hypothetical protein
MLNHPEQSSSEEFVGNTHRGESAVEFLHKNGITTARLGEQAYDIDGKKLPKEIFRPIIIGREHSKKYDDVMMSIAFGDGFRHRA